MKIQLTSVLVDDQDRALAFYTDVLGFVRKQDIPVGQYRWVTVVSPEGHDDVELLLEPTGFEPSQVYQRALFEAKIAAAAFAVDDIHQEYERLIKLGVNFSSEPQVAGDVTIAVLEDTCGNLIQLYQV